MYAGVTQVFKRHEVHFTLSTINRAFQKIITQSRLLETQVGPGMPQSRSQRTGASQLYQRNKGSAAEGDIILS